MDNQSHNRIVRIVNDVLKWSLSQDFKGWDPYDGLNSFLFSHVPLRNKYYGIAITQFFKRFPLNLRPFFGVRKMKNAKCISIYIMGLLNLYRVYKDKKYLSIALELAEWLIKNSSPYTDKYAWGYNFPWQSRNSYKPAYYPNVVTTVFCAMSLYNVYKETGNRDFLDAAISSGDFILKDLNIYQDKRGICYSYSPMDTERVYNATLLASMLLIELWNSTGREEFYEQGMKSVEFAINSQNADGSWFYGDSENQKWIDNFHTGYNLWALYKISELVEDSSLEHSIKIGYEYYKENLFTSEFLTKNTNHSIYPMDVHSFAVASIVFGLFSEADIQRKIINDAIKFFYSGKGYFHYWITPYYKIKIPYIRWSNGWMFFSLTEYLKSHYK